MCSVSISVSGSSPTGFHVPTENQFSLLWEHVQVGKTVNSAWKSGLLLNVQLLKASALDPSGASHSFPATPEKRHLSGLLPADSFVQNTAQHRHHPFFLPTRWLIYKGAGSQAHRTCLRERLLSIKAATAPLFHRRFAVMTLLSISPSNIYILSSVCCPGVYKAQLWSHL